MVGYLAHSLADKQAVSVSVAAGVSGAEVVAASAGDVSWLPEDITERMNKDKFKGRFANQQHAAEHLACNMRQQWPTGHACT